MSLLWYLVRDDNLTLFELNRGDWVEHFGAPVAMTGFDGVSRPRYAQPSDDAAWLQIVLAVRDLGRPIADREYATWLAKELWDWTLVDFPGYAVTLRIINDAGDEADEVFDRSPSYRVTGTRMGDV